MDPIKKAKLDALSAKLKANKAKSVIETNLNLK